MFFKKKSIIAMVAISLVAGSVAIAQAIRPASLGSESFFLIGTNGNSLELKPGNMSASFSLTLPDADGGNGQVLQTDGAGLLSWTSSATSGVPSGAVISFAGVTCPTGYVAADGKSYPQGGSWAALFTAIGTVNGNGSTGGSGDTGCPAGSGCFNVPDYRGRFLRGVDGGVGRDPDSGSRPVMATGGNTNNNVGSVQTDAFASHTHEWKTGGGTTGGQGRFAGDSSSSSYSSGSTAIQATGGSTETRPENAYVNFCIKI